MGILGMLISIVGLVCFIIILIDAFKNAVWKGILGIFCFLYLIYYAFAEFQHEKKGLIIAGWLLPWIIGYGLMTAGGLMALGGR